MLSCEFFCENFCILKILVELQMHPYHTAQIRNFMFENPKMRVTFTILTI